MCDDDDAEVNGFTYKICIYNKIPIILVQAFTEWLVLLLCEKYLQKYWTIIIDNFYTSILFVEKTHLFKTLKKNCQNSPKDITW